MFSLSSYSGIYRFSLYNNGLDSDENFSDLGLYETTENEYDKAKFKTLTLRNIEVTAPYMHDGRFSTLEEVLDHYDLVVMLLLLLVL